RIADRPERRRWHRRARRNLGHIDGAIRKEAGAGIVDHIEATGVGIRWRQIGAPWQRSQIIHDRPDAGLGLIAAFSPTPVSDECGVDRTPGRWIGDLPNGWLRRQIAELFPEDVVSGAQHSMLHTGSTHDGLMVV